MASSEALAQARAAANGADIRIGGGVATIRQYLHERLIDELHLAISPVLLGSGEQLFAGLDMTALGYRVAEQVAGENATHVVIKRTTERDPLRTLGGAGGGRPLRSPVGSVVRDHRLGHGRPSMAGLR